MTPIATATPTATPQQSPAATGAPASRVSAPTAPVSVVILTLNEEVNIADCLASCAWCDDVHVLDSGSTDRTVEIARKLGAKVHVHPFESCGNQRNWAIDNIHVTHDWVFHLDADERFTPELVAAMRNLIATDPRAAGFHIPHKVMFMGNWLKRSAGYPTYQMRLFHKKRMRFCDHGHGQRELTEGEVGTLDIPYLHLSFSKGLYDWIDKHNRYSSLEALQAVEATERNWSFRDMFFGDPVHRWRAWKEFGYHLPWRARLRWFVTLFILGGIFEGRAGSIYARLIFMYESMITLKMDLLRLERRRTGAAYEQIAGSPPRVVAVDSRGRAVTRPSLATSRDARIIGLSVYHGDAAAAALIGGQFITGVEEERFTRVKHWAGFPRMAMRHCVQEIADGDINAIDALGVARQPRAHFGRKVMLTLSNPRSILRAANRMRAMSKVRSMERTIAQAFRIPVSKVPPLHRVEHHLAHIASSFFCCPWDEAMCLTVDGFGDFASGMRAIGRGNRIIPIDQVYYPHSLGMFYTAVTQFMGFPNYGDEYKMMGLAAYGEPKLVDKLRKIVLPTPDGRYRLDLRYFRHLREGVDMTWEDGEPTLGPVYSEAMQELLGQPPRGKGEELSQWHKDLAASAQQVYEERFFDMVRSLQKMTGLKKLALAGGCAMNSLANGRLFANTDITDVYIQAAAGDAGTSLGAALYVYHSILNHPRSFEMVHSYWGPQFSMDDIRRAVAAGIPGSGGRDGNYGECTVETITDENRLCDTTAEGIAAGEVVGWYQGRSEWGPRALGNRSILADPRRKDMRDILNIKIKRRESFRPFAPSILEDRVADWFTITYPDPFMLKVYPIVPAQRSRIPAVTHVDGSGRLQTVSQRTNPLYDKLIQAFEKLTGVPVLLNTSFNENEPIVNTPTEALACFLRTKMDRLVMGNLVIRRDPNAEGN